MKQINKLAVMAIGLVLVGCVNADKTKTPPITAKTGQDLDNLETTLSQADGKAVLIREWLKSQN